MEEGWRLAESHYRVEEQLLDQIKAVAHDQRGANVSVDLRLCSRHDLNGQFKGGVRFLEHQTGSAPSGAETLALDSEDGLIWSLGLVNQRGFELVRGRLHARTWLGIDHEP